MALQLSQNARNLLNQVNITQQIIVDIDGIDLLFSSIPILKIATWGDFTFGDGTVYGGTVENKNSRSYLDLNGTTTTINQQIEIDKGGAGSISKFNVRLIDKDQELSALFQPGNVVADMLSRRVDIYVNFGSAHPQDSVRIFSGLIDNISYPSGACEFTVAHPEFLKNQDILVQANTQLDGSIDDTTTTITVKDASLLIPGLDILTSYVQIEDELVSYTGVSTNTLTGVVRGALGTSAVAHDDESDSTSFYTLEGDPITVALKLMMSDGGSPFITDKPVTRFVDVEATTSIANSIFIDDFNAEDSFGLVPGDLVTITGATNGANNVVDAPILSFTILDTGTAITLSGVTLVPETLSSAVASFTSKYNTLPAEAGCAMSGKDVDVPKFEDIFTQFNAQFPDYTLYIDDTINGKTFIADEIFKPANLYQVPRKARASVAITSPPLNDRDTVTLNEVNVINPDKLKMTRTTNKNFYNNVTWRYDVDSLDTSKYLAGNVTFSNRSITRIGTKTRSYKVDSTGLRNNSATDSIININSRRVLDRFQFGAESISVDVLYKAGFGVEVADTVIFGSPALQVTDNNLGNRNFEPRLFEVINISKNLSTGKAQLSLLDTAVALDGRYRSIAPSSLLTSDSTDTVLSVKNSFGEDGVERDKWEDFIGEEIFVHNVDFTISDTGVISSFSSTDTSKITLQNPLSFTPGEDYILELPNYPDTVDPADNALMKALYAFWNPHVVVTSGTSTSFDVGAGDIGKFFVGSFVRVHNADYSDQSIILLGDEDLEVTDITSLTVTVNNPISFTPVSGDQVELVGFKDQGSPYRIN
jgi:hypothetical protein